MSHLHAILHCISVFSKFAQISLIIKAYLAVQLFTNIVLETIAIKANTIQWLSKSPESSIPGYEVNQLQKVHLSHVCVSQTKCKILHWT